MLLGAAAEAQEYRQGAPLRLNVRPRSFLDAGNVVAPNSAVNPASAYGQTVSYLNSPPYAHNRDRFAWGNLPDPVTNGPFPGWTSPLGPVDLFGEFED
jgi:hypothetical protein